MEENQARLSGMGPGVGWGGELAVFYRVIQEAKLIGQSLGRDLKEGEGAMATEKNPRQSRKLVQIPERRLCLKGLRNQRTPGWGGGVRWLRWMNPERAIGHRGQGARHHLRGHCKDLGAVERDGKALEGSDLKNDVN